MNMNRPAEPIDGYEVWLVEENGERFWYVLDAGATPESAVALHVAEHGVDADEETAARRATRHEVLATVPVEEGGWPRMTISEAARIQVRDIQRRPHPINRCFVSTVW